MRLPKFVDVLGTHFEVHEHLFPRDREEEQWGESHQAQRRILVQKDARPDVKVEIFYHELAHIILCHSGMSDILTDQEHEAIAQCFGVALSYILTHNKLPKVPR